MASKRSYKEIESIIDQVAEGLAKKAMSEFEEALAKAEEYGYQVEWSRDGSAMIFDGNGEAMLEADGYSRWELFVPAIKANLNLAKEYFYSVQDFRNLLKGKPSVPYGSWYSWQIDLQQADLAQQAANYKKADDLDTKISKLKAEVAELELAAAVLRR